MFRLGRLSVVLVLLTTILIASLSSAAPIDESSDKPQERPGSQPQSPASDSWTRDSVKRLARQIQDEANREWDACMARYVSLGSTFRIAFPRHLLFHSRKGCPLLCLYLPPLAFVIISSITGVLQHLVS